MVDGLRLRQENKMEGFIPDSEFKPDDKSAGKIVSGKNQDFIPDDQFKPDEETYGTTLEQAKTFGQSALSGATFGLSDQALVKAGIMDPEKARLRKEVNPGVAMAGELTGIGASMLVPGAGEVNAVKGLNAVKGVTAATELATHAVEPTIAKLASKIANPELYPTAHKVLSKAGSTAIGSALEGSVYGAGQSISEDALGEHDLTGESLLSNMGMGALYGFGSGAAIGGVLGAIKPKVANSAKDILDAAGSEQNSDFVSTITNSAMNKGEKEGILSGLAKQKSNVKELNEAASSLGVDVTPGQISDSKLVQDSYSMLTQSPTIFGVQEQQKIANNFKKVAEQVGETLGGTENLVSKAELGETLQKSITDKLEQQYEPIKNLYKAVEERAGAIKLQEDEQLQLMQTIQDFAKKEGLFEGGAPSKFVKTVMDTVPNLKDYSQLDSFMKSLYREAPMESKWVATGLRSAIEETSDKILMDFAEAVGADDVTGHIALQISGARAAKPAYKALINDIKEISNVLGKKNVKGPQDFFDFLNEAKTPEMVANKLFQKENSRFVKSFSSKFPDEWNAIKQYQKGKIFSDSLKDGEININKVLRKVDKMEPELKKALFNEKELKTLKDANTWIESFPENINPSRTEITRAFRDFFENPISSAMQTARDMSFKQGYKALGLSSGETQKYQMLRKIEKSAIETKKAIVTNVNFALSLGDKEIKNKLSLNDDDKKKMEKDIQEYANNPEKFIKHLDENTQSLYANAPSINGQFQQAANRANQFLASKLPQVPDQKPLSAKYEVSKSDMDKFMRYANAVHYPTSILTHIKKGNLTKESLEAVQFVYPKMFLKMQEEAINSISGMDKDKIKKMPYKIKMGFSMLLGSDLTTGLDAKSIIANQSSLNDPNSKQSGEDQLAKVSQKGLSSITAPSSILTDSQKTARDIT